MFYLLAENLSFFIMPTSSKTQMQLVFLAIKKGASSLLVN
ncbi:hypothetical protein PALI_a1639 [Pseudoalteromonas aliena SW19]|uniref:Uncharacterized protein n=1 Tax=Pseudoalteromonas aliena SW19 TaxID=1314866 RepID=A0ABR9DYW7_9GAMM|nr:hypothetical protein [Pseudoalteromonas aliena SW19]